MLPAYRSGVVNTRRARHWRTCFSLEVRRLDMCSAGSHRPVCQSIWLFIYSSPVYARITWAELLPKSHKATTYLLCVASSNHLFSIDHGSCSEFFYRSSFWPRYMDQILLYTPRHNGATTSRFGTWVGEFRLVKAHYKGLVLARRGANSVCLPCHSLRSVFREGSFERTTASDLRDSFIE